MSLIYNFVLKKIALIIGPCTLSIFPQLVLAAEPKSVNHNILSISQTSGRTKADTCIGTDDGNCLFGHKTCSAFQRRNR